MVKITQIRKDDSSLIRRGKAPRVARIYVDQKERPINQGKIIEDFAWRRNHKPPKLNKKLAELMKKYFDANNIKYEDIIVRYSRYCGCTMCPCSPGFNINVKGFEAASIYYVVDIWVEVDEH
jgi:hypothetical protein